MCIAILSTSHPDYPFILTSNRDEYISRPTMRAAWWDPPNQQVLGGRDAQRAERGTWLGITKQGRIAILTNFREEGVEVNLAKSRGAITNSYLCIPPTSTETEEDHVRRLLSETGTHDVGGFTLIFGKLRAKSSGLAVVSNRTESAESLTRIAAKADETHGLSNSHYGDRSWPKVVRGEELLREAITSHISSPRSDQSDLVESLFSILSVDNLPKRHISEDWDAYVRHMRDSILISPAKGDLAKRMANYVPAVSSLTATSGAANGTGTPDHASPPVSETAYGTCQQTVILVNTEGKVTFVERTLCDREGRPVGESERDLKYEFEIDGWHGR